MFYKTTRWLDLRQVILSRDTHTCQMCGALLKEGKSNKETTILRPFVADHIIPHRGNDRLFFSTANVWAVCCDCHDGPCQSIEKKYTGQLNAHTARQLREDKLSYRVVGLDGYRRNPPHRTVTDDPEWLSVPSW